MTYLIEFLLPIVFSSCHGFNAMGQAGDDPSCSRLEGNCLTSEINPVQVDWMATPTGGSSARWKAVDCPQGYGGRSEGEWVTPCSSVSLMSRRSESRWEGGVVGRRWWAWLHVPRSGRSRMITGRPFLGNIVDGLWTLRNAICSNILRTCGTYECNSR